MVAPGRNIAQAKDFIAPPGYSRHRPAVTTQVLGIVYRAISGHLIRQAGLTRASAVAESRLASGISYLLRVDPGRC
jgi:hypothetical protein